ncbi:MAG: hypothetical protein IJS61_08850 [Firmicutes bacterium]|nr:hypothetical protein [Bacillota bacterium]
MTSEKSFFKLLMLNIRNRPSAVAISLIIQFFSFIVPAAFAATAPGSGGDWALTKYFFYLNPGVSFYLGFGAVVAAVTGFHFLHSRNKTDFYHSLPIKREKLFLVVYVSGALIVLIPYYLAATFALLIAVIKATSAEPATYFLMGISANTLGFLAVYSSCVLAAVLTGNAIISFIMCGVVNFMVPVAIAVFELIKIRFLSTYKGFYVLADANDTMPISIRLFSSFFGYLGLLAKIDIFGVVVALFQIVVFTALALFAYKKRKSENTGKAVVHERTKQPLKYVIVILSSLLGGLIFSGVGSVFWTLFGILSGAMVPACIIESIYHFDAKKMLENFKGDIICIVVAMLIFGGLAFDPLKVDEFVPPASMLKSARVDINSLYGIHTGRSRITLSGKALNAVTELAREGRDNTKKKYELFSVTRKNIVENSDGEYGDFLYLDIDFNYILPYSESREYSPLYTSQVEKGLKELFECEGVKEELFPLIKDDSYEDMVASVSQTFVNNTRSVDNVRITSEFLQAYKKDVENMTFEDLPRISKVDEVGEIHIDLSSIPNLRERSYNIANRFPIYSSFKNTREYLKRKTSLDFQPERPQAEETDKDNLLFKF